MKKVYIHFVLSYSIIIIIITSVFLLQLFLCYLFSSPASIFLLHFIIHLLSDAHCAKRRALGIANMKAPHIKRRYTNTHQFTDNIQELWQLVLLFCLCLF